MTAPTRPEIGVMCSYAPLPLIDAAGFSAVRVLPISDSEDQAGQVLHDNLCPHVKRILDRVMADESATQLHGVVVVNCCDAMRRLGDAWQDWVPDRHLFVMDLPMSGDELAISFLANECRRLAATLEVWGGRDVTTPRLDEAMTQYRELCDLLAQCRKRQAEGVLPGGMARLQEITNMAVTAPFEQALGELRRLVKQDRSGVEEDGVPVFLVGNVLPDPQAMNLLSSCGVRIVGDDLCTSRRSLQPLPESTDDDPFLGLARGLLHQDRCARMMDGPRPFPLGPTIARRAKACGARGVIVHTAKFCDPYLSRMPWIKTALDAEGLPVIVLEGDCTLRSLGQYKTRIEAFAEMLR